MRFVIALPVLILAATSLGGCSGAAAPGVLPRDPVPPPPSMRTTTPKRPETTGAVNTNGPRRPLSVPERAAPPRPAM